jgi:hypothetical protein
MRSPCCVCVFVSGPITPESRNSAVTEVPQRWPLQDNGSVIRSFSSAFCTLWPTANHDSESELVTTGDLPPVSSSWRQAPWDWMTSNFVFQLNTSSYTPYVTSSLTEDRSVVYSCCWSLPAQSFSGPSPLGLMTTSYCLRLKTPLTWRARSRYLYPPGTGWPGYALRHWVPFLSPPMTRNAMVEVFNPTSTWEDFVILRLSSLYNLRSDCRENTASNSSSVLTYFPRVSVSMCIPPFIARQQLRKHIPAATNTHTTIEQLLNSLFSMWRVLYKKKVGELFFP